MHHLRWYLPVYPIVPTPIPIDTEHFAKCKNRLSLDRQSNYQRRVSVRRSLTISIIQAAKPMKIPQKYLAIFLIGLAAFLAGCATVYESSDFDYYQSSHQLVAILPFQVTINLKELPEGATASVLQGQERDEGFLFQQQIYTKFMQQYGKGKYTIDFQDAEKSNILLQRAGIEYERIKEYTKSELAEILGVDSIISGTISRSKPMGTGAAVFSQVLLNTSATNNVNINMNLHEGENGKLLWSYDHQVTGKLGSSAEGMAKALMGGIARKFPYNKN